MWFLLSIAALLAVSLQSDAAQRCPTFHHSRLNPLFNQTTREWKMAVQYYESGNPLYNCTVKLSTMLTGGAEFEEFSRTTNPEYCSSAAQWLCTMKLPLPTCEGNVVTPVEFKLETTGCQGKRCGVASAVYKLPSFEFLESYTCTEKNTVFKTCGTHKTCKTVSEEKSAGCFCKDGWLWDEIGSKCAEKSASCPGEDEPQAKNLSISVPDCVVDSKPGDDAVFMISWDVDSSREYNFELKDSKGESVLSSDFPRRLSGKQPDVNVFYKIDSSRGVITMPNSILYVETFTVSITDLTASPKNNEVASFKVQKGCNRFKPLKINTSSMCQDAQPVMTLSWDVESKRSYKYIIESSSQSYEGEVPGSGNSDFVVANGRGSINVKVADDGYNVTVRDLTSGVTAYQSERTSINVQECKIPHLFNLVTPTCIKSSASRLQISWSAKADRKYSWELSIDGSKFSSGEFSNGVNTTDVIYNPTTEMATLTISAPSGGEFPTGQYMIVVSDLSAYALTSEQAEFPLKKGCKNLISLEIVAQGKCKNGKSAFSISWAVKKSRDYYYEVKKGSTVVQEGTVSGAGEIGFEVSNGRGTIFSIGPLVSGGYTVEVQDLDAGVNAYYTEDASFTVSSCNINLRMFSGCARRGEPISLDVIDAMMTTYQFTIVVESTQVRVLSATATVNQVTGVATTTLNNSASLAVGRYVIAARDKTTLAGGYARFLISDSGIVGGVRYTMDPLPKPQGVFVCIDPEQGTFFPPGLTITFGSNVQRNPNAGYCFWELYSGQLVEQTITVQPASGAASSAPVSYIG